MGPIKFKYSWARMLADWVFLSVAELALYLEIFRRGGPDNPLPAFVVFSFLIFLRLLYQFIYFYIPCLRGKSALELDREKLQFYIRALIPFHRTTPLIYWKDIKDIKLIHPAKSGAILAIHLKDDRTYSLPLRRVSGDDKTIYNSVKDFFEKRKSR